MKKRKLMQVVTALLCGIILLVWSGGAMAAKPAPTTGTLKGKVTVSGASTVISGALITAMGSSGQYTATTGTKGTYTLTLPAGTYSVTASASGYASQTLPASISLGVTTTLNFALVRVVPTTGTIQGTVTDSATGAAIAGAQVSTSSGGYSAVTNSAGSYVMTSVTAGAYTVTAQAEGYTPQSTQATVQVGLTSTVNFTLAALVVAVDITSLTADPASFVEVQAASVTLAAVITGSPSSFAWTQVAGPKVPLTGISATSAVADVSLLEVAAEADLVFRLVLDGTVARDVTVSVQPADMAPVLGANAQIGGSTTAVARFQFGGAEWCLFNIGTELNATPVGAVKGPVYKVVLPEFAFGIEVVSYNGSMYALAAIGGSGIAVVNITDPAQMSLVSVTPVNYYMDNVTYTETGGAILPGNIMSSSSAPIADVVSDGTDLYIADNKFGIHKTSLANLFNRVLEADLTLKIDSEVCTVQYAGEGPWGGPITLKLVNQKLFAAMGVLGVGIFDPVSLQQIARYNLYTDEARTEDFFGAMAITQAVSSDAATGDLFIDDFTGMPDYRQVNYEITVVMKGTGTGEPTPWADLERNGKWYYEALDVDVAVQGDRSIAYIAYSLGGVIAVDVTGYENASATNFLNAGYLGFFPAVTANGPYETGSMPASLLPYEGAGMLKESGVTGVEVNANQVYLTDHFAGLVILDNAAIPDSSWHGSAYPYNNDTDGIAGNNVPEFEDITSYDMSPWDPLDNESLPACFYEAPALLATRELNGHGYTLQLMDAPTLTAAGGVDVLECSGAGGFVFVDITNIGAPLMEERFAILVYFPTTGEIGAAVDGTPTQTIAIGHAAGVDATDRYLYVSDGPHGVSAWQITDAQGFPTDAIHLVGNTLQDEYPIDGIYPASHTVRNVVDVARGKTWALCVGNGMRRVPIDLVEAGMGVVGAPILMPLAQTDSFEHNGDWGVVPAFNYQDQAYDVEFDGNYAFVADGTNGLTIYDVTKIPTSSTSGFFVGNIGYNQGNPLLGTSSGVELWTDTATGKKYAVLATGPYGVGIVDVSDLGNMRLVKVFQPIKYEDGDVGVADGQAIDVEVIGDKAYFTYDSFGVLCYAMADLIAAVPEGVSPTELFLKNLDGTVVYDYRPVALGRFKLQYVPGYETVAGGAVRMDYTRQNGGLYLYVGFGEAGLVKIDYTDSANPLLAGHYDTAAEAVDVVIANGRLYVADGGGGLVFLK
ncbi:MAG: carboxypeptidase regulatory-like domain-containing protein [Deltaproteobacteria bacterium]|nr:carboxypeptidase regulatory-like domain-containing protein [Deltaproteobacteria bacterium]